MAEKVFVTGATGRVGGALAQYLISGGAEVSTLVLPNDPGLERCRAMGVRCVIGSLTEPDTVREAMQGASSIYHMAAVISFKPTDRPLLWNVNVTGTRNVLEAAAELAEDRYIRLVFASSDQVYPTRFAHYRPTDEQHPREPYSYYGMTKQLCENIVWFYQRSVAQLSCSIAVFSHTEAASEIIDPNGEYSGAAFYVNGRVRSLEASSTHHAGANSTVELQRVIDMLRPHMADDEPLLLTRDAKGNAHSQELIDVRDIIKGLVLIHDTPAAVGEAFNLAPAHPVSLEEFIPYLANATGRRVVEATIPVEMGRTHGSNAKARAMLGFVPKYSMFDMVDEAVATTRTAGGAA